MITAGIDVGLENMKAVIMKDGQVVGKACGPSGGAGRPATAQAIYDQALKAAGVAASDVAKVIATGKGKFDVAFAADQLTESLTTAKAAKLANAGVTTAIDIGADEIVVVTMDGDKIKEFVINQKCGAGIGLMLGSIADRFEMSIDGVAALAGPSSVKVDDGCVVCMELDALGLANRGTDLKEIVKALNVASAWRANATLNDIFHTAHNCVVLMGGMAKNGAFVKALEEISGIKFVKHADPEFAGAIGAAALAAS